MKFYGKIFLSMLILVSISFSVFGSLMIHKSFQYTLEQEIIAGKNENQMLKLTLETTANSIPEAYYENQKKVIGEMAESIGKRMAMGDTMLVVYDKNGAVIYGKNKASADGVLFHQVTKEQSGYRIYQENDKNYLSVMGIIDNQFSENKMRLETITDITAIYTQRQKMLDTYRTIMLIMLGSIAVIALFISFFLTRSVRQLSKITRDFAKGNLEGRANVTSHDEIGVLAEEFNNMADELTDKMLSLKEHVRRQEEFTSAFAHELKTPLTSIIGYADMIRSMNLQEEERMKAAGYIYSQGKRLENLSFRLLELFVLKKQDFDFVAMDAKYFIEMVFDLAEVGVLEKGLVLKKRVEQGMVYGEKDLLISLFANLIDNAKKASEKGKTIWIEGKHVSEGYQIIVRDEGRGIPKEELSKIMDAFYMVDKSRSRKEGGAGLGMTLCNEIVTLHRGKWNIESEVGKGTCVTVTFARGEQNEKND